MGQRVEAGKSVGEGFVVFLGTAMVGSLSLVDLFSVEEKGPKKNAD